MKKFISVLLGVVVMSVAALATDITINSYSIPWTSPTSDVQIRFFLVGDGSTTVLRTPQGQSIRTGTPASGSTNYKYDCTYSGGNLTIPSVTLPATTDAIGGGRLRWSAVFYRKTPGTAIQEWANYTYFQLPHSTTPTTWTAIKAYNDSIGTESDPSKPYSRLETEARIVGVEGNISLKANKAGDTFTGPVVLSADPSTALQAATKQYVDNSNPIATVTTEGKFKAGGRVKYTLAGRPACNAAAAAVAVTIEISDSDRIPQSCKETSVGVYQWVRVRPYIDLRDFGIDGTAGDKTSAFAAAIALLNAGTVNEIRMPGGVIDLYSGVTITNDKAILVGDSTRGTELQIYHNGVAITYTPTVADLNESKPTFRDFSMRSMMNGGDAVKATSGSGWVGTAIKTNGGYGMTLRNLHIRNFSKGLHLKDTAVNVFENINVRNCYWGLWSEGWSNTNTFLGGVFSRASINTGEDWAFESTTVKGTDFTFIGTDFEPGSQTNKIGNRNKFLNCRIEQLHLDTFPTFFTWFDFLGDGNVMQDCDFYFGGASLPSTNKDQFFFDFTGDNNKINFRRIFMHNKLVRFKPDSNNNEVEFSTKFEDYLIGAPYPGSERFIRDNGVGNRVVVKSDSGQFTRIGAEGFADVGAIPSMLPQDSQAGLTLTRLSQAVSDVAGPFGVPASSFFIKKYTVTATDAAGAFANAPTIALGGADQVYTTTAYVYLPSSFPDANKVGVSAITAGHEFVYGTDRKSRWLPLTQYYVPGAATNVQPSIFTDAPSGTVFYVAFFSCLKGQSPAVAVPPASSQSYALSTILGTSSDSAWGKTIAGNVYVGSGAGGISDAHLEVGNTSSGGRISATDGGGSNRRALVFNSPTSATAYSRLFSFNYAASIGLPLVLNDPGGNVYIGKTTGTEALDVNGSIKASNYSYGLRGMFGTYSSVRGEELEVAQTTGGRIVSTDGQGSNSRALVISSGYSAQAYARVFAYNYSGSAGMTLALNDPGGDVAVGKTTASEKLDVNGNVKATGFKLANVVWTQGAGAPVGACTTGSLYSRTDGGAATSLYVCESSAWVAK